MCYLLNDRKGGINYSFVRDRWTLFWQSDCTFLDFCPSRTTCYWFYFHLPKERDFTCFMQLHNVFCLHTDVHAVLETWNLCQVVETGRGGFIQPQLLQLWLVSKWKILFYRLQWTIHIFCITTGNPRHFQFSYTKIPSL